LRRPDVGLQQALRDQKQELSAEILKQHSIFDWKERHQEGTDHQAGDVNQEVAKTLSEGLRPEQPRITTRNETLTTETLTERL
jgi:hypothetical protein